MILGYLFLMVAAALIFALLIPPIKVEDARAGEFEEDSFPKASEDSPITYLIGKDQIKSPNTLFVGNFSIEPQTKRVRTGIFSRKTVTTHYKYFITIDLGLCIGGDDGCTLHQIIIDDEVVWEGDVVSPDDIITIDKPELFGGDEAGGGFVGIARFYPGTYGQAKNAHIDGLEESQGLLTKYKGVSHIVFENCFIGESAQLRPIKFVMSRFTSSLDTAQTNQRVDTTTVNVAEALYAAMTDEWAGLGMNPDYIDEDSFIEAAEVYTDERNGAAGGVYRSKEGGAFIQEMLRQVDTIMTVNPYTNKIILKPMRKDYDISAIPTFSVGEIKKVEVFSQTLWDGLVSQVKISFKNENKDYADTTAVDQDLAVANITGQLKTTTLAMPFVKKKRLANKIAGRELNQLSKPAASATLTFNRHAHSLLPGGVFIWTWPDYGIDQMVMRVKKVRGGDNNDPTIRVECVRDPYGDVYTTFGEPESYSSPTLIDDPLQVTEYHVMDAPLFLLDQAGISRTTVGTPSYLLMLPISPGGDTAAVRGYLDYNLTAYTDRPFPLTGTLQTGISLLDGFSTGTITAFDVATVTMPDSFSSNASGTEMREGQNLFMIGQELFSFDSYTQSGTTYTLTSVRRALLNTTQSTHAEGARVIWLDDLGFLSEQPLEAGDSPSILQFLTGNGLTRLSSETATAFTVVHSGASKRPDQPDYLRIDSNRVVADLNDGSSLAVSWRSRNSEKGSIQFVDDAADAVLGMTFNVYVYNLIPTPALIYSNLGVSGESLTFDLPTGQSNDTLEVRVYSVKNSLISINYDWLRFNVLPAADLLLSGDVQSGVDNLLLEGDELTTATDQLAREGDMA
jgi:hypothetical protein